MCHQRLADGEAPACVQACPTEAIRIVNRGIDLSTKPISGIQAANRISSDARFPKITLPTTRYIGRDIPSTAIAADHENLIPEHAHWPLVAHARPHPVRHRSCSGSCASLASDNSTLLIGTLIFFAGMGRRHLPPRPAAQGMALFPRPPHHWLSREILAFSLFAPIPPLLCALPFLDFSSLKLSSMVSDLVPFVTTAAVLPAIPLALHRRLHQRDDLPRYPPHPLALSARRDPLLRHRGLPRLPTRSRYYITGVPAFRSLH